MSTLWGGRFQSGPSAAFASFNQSLSFDQRLFAHDVAGSRAYAHALGKARVLSEDDVAQIISALDAIEKEINDAVFARAIEDGVEDVHSLVETLLIAKVGDLGKKLHTGRSRNDQVATDFRLYVRQETLLVKEKILILQDALKTAAARDGDAILPGYTHLQRAQPVLWKTYLHSFVEMLHRDFDRFDSSMERASVMPLGSGALAGNPWNIDRVELAQELGFTRASTNSMDAVSDRDFVCDFLFASAQCSLHLSRLAEDLIIYSSQEFHFVTLSDAVTSGSSLMPQKKNPDSLELIRGKTGRLIGHLTGFLCVLKGLGSCYNKDLQEDKDAVFDTTDTLKACLDVATTVIQTLTIHRDVMLKATQTGFLNATDLADYLVTKGVAFRDAHHIVGKMVMHCLHNDCALDDISLPIMRDFCPAMDEDVFEFISIPNCIRRKLTLTGECSAGSEQTETGVVG